MWLVGGMVLGCVITLLARFVFRRFRLCLSGDDGKLGTRCMCLSLEIECVLCR